jgi:hypothetical protein
MPRAIQGGVIVGVRRGGGDQALLRYYLLVVGTDVYQRVRNKERQLKAKRFHKREELTLTQTETPFVGFSVPRLVGFRGTPQLVSSFVLKTLTVSFPGL